jgi:carboxypeptidase T
MKNFFLLLCGSLSMLLVNGQELKYSEILVHLNGRPLSELAATGIAANEGPIYKDGTVRLVLSQEELSRISAAGFSYDVLQADYEYYIATRNRSLTGQIREINSQVKAGMMSSGSYPVPTGFELGSMGGYYTLEEVWEELDSLHNLYPDLITAKAEFNSTKTIEGRPVYFVKISDNPNVNEDEPRVFYDALTHAREPMGMQEMFFFMDYLLEHYATDPEIQYLVNNTELYFIPVINPDGYYQNEQNAPFGGGSWRKNKRNNGDGSYGVDLNRNFGYKWGYDNIGSSPVTWDETYRGTGPFSEPETQIVRDFGNDRNFRLAINYHTFGDILIYPWCYVTEQTPDSTLFRTYSDLLTRDNLYRAGPPGQILYNTNGDINDWLYGDTTSRMKVFTFAPEVGGDLDGFWPQPSHIIPLAQECMLMNLLVAHLAGRYAEVYDRSPAILGDRQGSLTFLVERYGQDSLGEYTVSVQPLDSTVILQVGDPKTFSGMALFGTAIDSISYTLSPDLPIGSQFQFLLQVSNGFYTHSDTITKYFGPPMVVFHDNCSDFQNWTSPKWNITTAQYFSPPSSITDSPLGNYANNENNSVTLVNTIDLHDSPVAVIEYRAKWNTEQGFDYVQCKASTGTSFTPLAGRFTHPGGDSEPQNQPLYDGLQPSWVPEQIVTTSYAGQDIKLQFTLHSDTWTTYDGFYFDDLKVTVIDMSAMGMQNLHREQPWLSTPYPNPASGSATFRYRLPDWLGSPAELLVLDLAGSEILRIPVPGQTGNLPVNISELKAGIYFCRIEAGTAASPARKLVVVR